MRSKKRIVSYFILMLSLLFNTVGANASHAMTETTSKTMLNCMHQQMNMAMTAMDCCDDFASIHCEQCMSLTLSVMLTSHASPQTIKYDTINTPSFTQSYLFTYSPLLFRPPIHS